MALKTLYGTVSRPPQTRQTGVDGTHVWNLDGTYNIWKEPEHTQNGWNLFMFPNRSQQDVDVEGL